jgi:hypothetical protein
MHRRFLFWALEKKPRQAGFKLLTERVIASISIHGSLVCHSTVVCPGELLHSGTTRRGAWDPTSAHYSLQRWASSAPSLLQSISGRRVCIPAPT